LTALRDRLRELAGDSDVHVVVLTGAGDRAFAAGGGIKEMGDTGGVGSHARGARRPECGRPLGARPKTGHPAGNRISAGRGAAPACDIRYASENAKFGQPEINIGVIPGWGGTQRLARAVGAGLAKDLILTGRTIDAAEALRIGLVSAVHPADQLLERTLETA